MLPSHIASRRTVLEPLGSSPLAAAGREGGREGAALAVAQAGLVEREGVAVRQVAAAMVAAATVHAAQSCCQRRQSWR